MKKKVLILALAVMAVISLFLFAGCNKGSDKIPEIKSDNDKVITGEVNSLPSESDPKDALYISLGKLSALETYRTESKGAAVSSIAGGLFSYVQKNDCGMIKSGDEYYTFSNSYSRFVSVKHEAFGKGENVAYRKNGEDIVNASAIAYKEVYGVLPTKLLSGHVFNDETIKSAELCESANGNYVFKIVLDKEKGNVLLYKQMKEFGNLNGYPVFTEDTVVYLTVKEDYTPVKVSYESKYKVNVSLLGEIPCTENNEVTFYDINGSVNIPDEEAFNAALAENPSVIVPSEEKVVDKKQEKVVGALLKADLIRGVALNGVIECNGVELPIKINGRADIDKIMNDENADILSLIDLKVSLGVYEDSLAVTYHDKKLYFDLADVKFAKELDFDDISGETEAIAASLGNSDISSYFKITEEEGDIYRVRLNNVFVKNMIKSVLVNAGLAGDNVSECFDLSVGLYIPTDRVGVISLDLTTDLIDFNADFNLSDEKFVLPADENYPTEPLVLKTGFDVSFNLAGYFTATGKAYVSYDITEFDPQKALKAELNVTLGNNLKGILAMSSSFSSDVPAWIGAIAKADTVNLVYSDGRLMLIAVKGDKPTFVKEIPVGADGTKVVNESDTDPESSPFDFETIESMISELIELKISDNVISLNVKDEAVNLLGTFWNGVPELIMKSAGKTAGVMLGSYVGMPLKDIGIDFNVDEKTMNLYVDAHDVNVAVGGVYIDGRDYETSRLLDLTVSVISADDYSCEWNIGKIYEDYVKAEEIIEATERIAEVSIADGYTEEVSRVKALYDGLSDDQKSLCYTVSGTAYYDKLIASSEKLVTAADDFAGIAESGKINTLNSKYNKFTAEQLEYLSATYPVALETYISRRVESEAASVAALKTFIDGTEVHTDEEFGAMNASQIYTLFNTFAGKYESFAALCSKSQEGLDTQKFETELNGVVQAYARIIGELAESTKEQVLSSDNLSVEELLNLYSVVKGFDRKYSSGFTSKKIWSLVKEADPDLEVKCYLAEYYLTVNGSAFRKYAVLAIEEEIESLTELVKGEYNTDELAERVGNVDKLTGYTDKSAISNTDKLDVLKASYYESIVSELKESLPDITAKLAEINNNPSANDIDWDGVDAEAQKYNDMINVLSADYKETISDLINEFKTQKSSFDDNYFDYAF